MNGIKHIIVLMLENRSFDHMLGLLDHPCKSQDPTAFLQGNESNPSNTAGNVKMQARPGDYGVNAKPGHDHSDVMEQMTHGGKMQGFAMAHEGEGGDPCEVMRALTPNEVPVLSQLARQYHLCTRWFCSVPGATWPNRFFAMAGSSAGHVDNEYLKVPVDVPAVFRALDAKKDVSWRIYHDGPCLAMLMREMTDAKFHPHYSRTRQLLSDIRNTAASDFPAFSWVEPDHFGRDSSSQHPGFMDRQCDNWSFAEGEKLIADIYDALKENKTLFDETLFIVTYDEHGGFYDHVYPEHNVSPPNDLVAENGFDFCMTGPRVPAVLINPRMRAGTLDAHHYDHACLVKMLVSHFGLDASFFNSRRVNEAENPMQHLELQDMQPGDPRNIITLTRLPMFPKPGNIALMVEKAKDGLLLSLLKGVVMMLEHYKDARDGMGIMKLAGDNEVDGLMEDLNFYIDDAQGTRLMTNMDRPQRTAVDAAHRATEILLSEAGQV